MFSTIVRDESLAQRDGICPDVTAGHGIRKRPLWCACMPTSYRLLFRETDAHVFSIISVCNYIITGRARVTTSRMCDASAVHLTCEIRRRTRWFFHASTSLAVHIITILRTRGYLHNRHINILYCVRRRPGT